MCIRLGGSGTANGGTVIISKCSHGGHVENYPPQRSPPLEEGARETDITKKPSVTPHASASSGTASSYVTVAGSRRADVLGRPAGLWD
jgi:hypothetical protein